MRLTRSWEEEYSPDRTGGLRLSKASAYGAVGEEAGPGVCREGEVRTRFDGVDPAVERESADGPLPRVRRVFEEYRGSAQETEELRGAILQWRANFSGLVLKAFSPRYT